MQKPKVDKQGETFYGNYDRNADGTWKRGLDSGMVMWNTNVPYKDTTGYVDKSYFDSEIGYLSCYVATDFFLGNKQRTLTRMLSRQLLLTPRIEH